MNNEQVNHLIQNIGLCTELWIITYSGFKRQGLDDNTAILHTKAFMATMLESFMVPNSGGMTEQEVK